MPLILSDMVNPGCEITWVSFPTIMGNVCCNRSIAVMVVVAVVVVVVAV